MVEWKFAIKRLEEISRKAFEKANFSGIWKLIDKIDWKKELAYLNVNEGYEKFLEIFEDAVSKHVPV